MGEVVDRKRGYLAGFFCSRCFPLPFSFPLPVPPFSPVSREDTDPALSPQKSAYRSAIRPMKRASREGLPDSGTGLRMLLRHRQEQDGMRRPPATARRRGPDLRLPSTPVERPDSPESIGSQSAAPAGVGVPPDLAVRRTTARSLRCRFRRNWDFAGSSPKAQALRDGSFTTEAWMLSLSGG